MEEVSIVAIDLANNIFQLHGARSDGSVAFRKKVARSRVLVFFAAQPRCLVPKEACASSHHWAREIRALGHDVRLIAPAYVKPFVKRQKNDMADAEAIAEAATRPMMRFVPVKSVNKQASGMVFKARDLLVRQRTQTINALRGHLAEYGIIAPQGVFHVGRLVAAVEDQSNNLPSVVGELCRMLIGHVAVLGERVDELDLQIRKRAKQDEAVRRLMTIPLGDPSGIADAQQRECASAYCATRARKCQSK